jgi:hypothetical protein
MATLIQLEERNELFRLDPALGTAEMEDRFVYILPHAMRWLERTLPALGSTWNLEQSPAEQLDALMEIFCSGKRLSIGTRLKPLNHLSNGVWELKTADLRLFGWFPYKDFFIVSACNHTEQVKLLRLYRPYCEEAVRFRNALELDEPKFITGDDPNAVVSNCY